MSKQSRKSPQRKQDRSRPKDGEDAGAQPISKWEWVVAGLGALILVAMVGYLAYEAFAREQTPPEIELRQISVEAVGNGYLVRLRAVNHGGATAASVHVSAKLLGTDGKEVEKSEADFDYIPERGQRQGGVFFTHDPSRYKLELHAEGYVEP